MNKSDTIGALSLALSKAQGQIRGALRDSNNPFFKSKYADLESVWDACRAPLSTNELAVIQLSDETEKGIIVDTVLSHSSGEWISGRMFIPISSKLDAQTVGSATTYARRYCLQMIVGIAPVDDDGNGATGKDDKRPVSDAKVQTVVAEVVAPKAPAVSDTQAKYRPKIKEALDTLFGADTAAKKSECESLTEFLGKDGVMVAGVADYRTLDGERLQILSHKLDQTVAAAKKNAATLAAAAANVAQVFPEGEAA